MLTRTDVLQAFSNHINCCQLTLGEFAEQFGYDREETNRFAALFGGGMQTGNVCGVVTGALMAIGLYAEDDKQAHELAAAFFEKFKAKHGTLLCKELLGCDFSVPGERERAMSLGLTAEKCPDFILDANEILRELLV